ncbi:MAG: hypothetical protein PWQ65_1224, partial [Bacteroidota bacterium]|nr:hypothetical protein [Bacteroidota bacterium]
ILAVLSSVRNTKQKMAPHGKYEIDFFLQ